VIWLLIFASAVGFLLVCLLLEQLLFERRQPPPAIWRARPGLPPLPRQTAWVHADLRHTRMPGSGHHRKEMP
jgi:hypothetical protein